MGKLSVHTEEMADYLMRMHRHYEDQEAIIKKHLTILDEAAGLLAPEDLVAIGYEYDALQQKGTTYVNKKMPPLHDMLPAAKPVNPYIEAITTINRLLDKNEIHEFNQRIRHIQPFNRTTETKDGVTMEDLLTGAGEIVGVNDLYRVFNGKDPFTGEELTLGEWAEAVGWSALTLVPVAKAGKVGKVAKGTKKIKGVKGLHPSEKLAKLGEFSKGSLRTVKQKGKDLTAEGRARIQDFADRYANMFGNQPVWAFTGGNPDGVMLAKEQIYSYNEIRNIDKNTSSFNVTEMGKKYKNYEPMDYKGTTKVNGENRNISRRVYKRKDIDITLVDPKTGLTNLELMKLGRPPIWKDGSKIDLHHLIQKEPGSMVELPKTLHQEYTKVLHGLVENGGSFRRDPLLKKQYNNFRTKYWKWRASELKNN
ncbi:hypothetical protein GCM10011409_42950 [Lentibacillus populi]|uniref:LHH domain-containing protein n=1 Tax=Lentibacillus populi TaxID=1827502 RepID=A0A9W5U2B4_9BACI|nr:HNH/ENDO VII family nuclease [Lentibacillus populi]GGB61085.1 hypothetical protein GCM10011409_42950 [Lentibacillus populi]